MEEKIIHRIGLLGEKYGSMVILTEANEIPNNIKPLFSELAKDYERQKDFLEEVLKWHRDNNGR
jgi:hypothetical protein